MSAEPATRSGPRLLPPATKGATSVARVADDWYVAAASRDLRKKPLSVVLLGLPLVLFRDADGNPGALLDRCAHRNVPLSEGRVVGPHLQCGYHGWEFDTSGACRKVPGLCGGAEAKGRSVPAYPVREQDGFLWVYATPDVEPPREPFKFPHMGEKGYTTVRQTVEAEGSLHAVAENALDVPHTAFLHKGLFRGKGDPNEIEVAVRRYHDRVEAEYIGEPPPPGWAARILAAGAGDGTVSHFDRFYMPCVAQVEYRLGKTHFCVTTALTPVEDYRTRLFAVVTFRVPLPGFLVALVLAPLAKRIFAQDAVMLARQTETLRRFGGEQFVSTEVDALGQHILKLLKDAERGARPEPGEPTVKRFKMVV